MIVEGRTATRCIRLQDSLTSATKLIGSAGFEGYFNITLSKSRVFAATAASSPVGHSARKAGAEAQKNVFSPSELAKIENLAKELIKSCEDHPIPKPDASAPLGEFIYWIGYDAYIRAEVRFEPASLLEIG